MRTTRLLPLLAAGALVLSACTGDGAETVGPSPAGTSPVTGTDVGTPTPTGPTPPVPTVTASPTPTTSGVAAPSAPCELEASSVDGIESVSFAVPEEWQVEPGNCEFFDPGLEQLEEGTEPDAAIGVRVAEIDFATASQTEEIEGEIRWTGARSGYQAVRIRGGAAGQAIDPAGEAVQLYLVDLDAGTDDQGGTLVIRATPSSGADFDVAARMADQIAQTLRITPVATDAAPIVVTRAEGGGTPFAVTYDQGEGCFRLHAGGPTDEAVDEACDVARNGAEVAGAVLASGEREVVAGFAPALAVLVESDAETAPYGGITTAVEGGSLFAYEATVSPLDVRAIGPAGTELGTATIS